MCACDVSYVTDDSACWLLYVIWGAVKVQATGFGQSCDIIVPSGGVDMDSCQCTQGYDYNDNTRGLG